jgi:Protein of unknown function (DUF3563)
MKRLIDYLKTLFDRRDPSYDEEYLAEAADIYDLERRMRVLDRRRAYNSFYPAGSNC